MLFTFSLYSAFGVCRKSLVLDLASCSFIARRHNLVITGPTGVGKTYPACALANQACRDGYRALYQRLPILLHDLEIARGNGRYRTLLASLQKVDLLERHEWQTTNQLRTAIFAFIEIFYNRKRRHSSLDYQSPVEYERKYNQPQAIA